MSTFGTSRRGVPIRICRFDEVVMTNGEIAPDEPAKTRLDESIKLVWRSPIYDLAGRAVESRSFLIPLSKRLRHLRVDDIDSAPSRVSIMQADEVIIDKLRMSHFTSPFIEIVNQPPDMFRRNELAYYRIGRPVLEMPEMSPFWVEECNSMDELWAQSAFSAELLADSGVAAEKIRIVPCPIDTRVFSPRGGPEANTKSSGMPVRILSLLPFADCKGWEKLIEAYVREFTCSDNVELVIRALHPSICNLDIANQMDRFISELGVDKSRVAPITLISDGPLAKAKMSDLYRSSDVFVSSELGEGLGFTMLEAMACGIPVIATGWGGQRDFVTNENGWLVDYELKFVDPSYDPGLRSKIWAEPSLEHLRQCMREAYSSTDTRHEKARCAVSSAEPYDDGRITDTVVERLTAIEHERKPRSHQGSWKAKPWLMLTSPRAHCGIRQYSAELMAHGLSDRMSMASCPDLFRTFNTDADLLHVQYHSFYVNPHQLLNHTPKAKMVATVHDLCRFDEISHLFDSIMVITRKDYNGVLAMPRKDGAQVHLIPYGYPSVDTETLVDSGRVDPVIAFHGFASPDKGIKELIYALLELKRFHPGARLLIVSAFHAAFDEYGRGYLNECKQTASDIGLSNSVDFVTDFLPTEAIADLLSREADLVVLPYLCGGTSAASGAARVAIAAGKPVLTSNIPIFEDLTEEVIKFPLRQIPHLAEVLRLVWENKGLQHMVVRRGLAHANRDSWPEVARKTLEVLQSV